MKLQVRLTRARIMMITASLIHGPVRVHLPTARFSELRARLEAFRPCPPLQLERRSNCSRARTLRLPSGPHRMRSRYRYGAPNSVAA